MSSTAVTQGHGAPPARLWDGLRRFEQLPDWLAAAVRPERLRAALTRHVPELGEAAGRFVLTGVNASRLRFGHGRWTGRYRLTLTTRDSERGGAAAAAGAAVRQVELRGSLYPPGALPPCAEETAAGVALGAPGWRCRLPELGLDLEAGDAADGDAEGEDAPDAATVATDPALPALAQLTDPGRARALLERHITAASPAYDGLRLAGCTPRVVRYKPGSRCTILFDLRYAAPEEATARGWPSLVVAKTYRGDKGQVAFEGMRALWQSPLGRGDLVTIAEPLAYLPDLRVLLQGPIGEERTLKDLTRAAVDTGTPAALAVLHGYLAKTAAGLAALHTSGVVIGKPHTLEAELAEIRGVLGDLATAVPDLAGAADPLLARVEELAARHPADPPVPSHRSFRPAQVLLHRGRIGFIDFDGACQAEPALDLALLRATLKDVGLIRKETDGGGTPPPRDAQLAVYGQLDRACDAFLARYQERASVSPLRVLLWETLDVLAYVLRCWLKVKPERLWANMLMLERHLAAAGALR
jgi:hypothetical protein